jgi:DNA-binding response OmpR family regulator
VLVIAEPLGLRLQLRDLLRTNQRQVSAAASGHQAMLLAQQQAPDMVVASLPLHVLSAASTVQALRMEYGSALPVLALTPPGRQTLASELQASQVLELPFDAQQLEDAVGHHLTHATNTRSGAQRDAAATHSRAIRQRRLSDLLSELDFIEVQLQVFEETAGAHRNCHAAARIVALQRRMDDLEAQLQRCAGDLGQDPAPRPSELRRQLASRLDRRQNRGPYGGRDRRRTDRRRSPAVARP